MSTVTSDPAARPAAVTRTYGRPREPLGDLPEGRPVEPVPAYEDFAQALASVAPRASYAKGSALKTRVAASDSDEDSEKGDDGGHVSLPSGMYDWRKQLKAMDASGSEDEAKTVPKTVPSAKRATSDSPSPATRNSTRPPPKPSARQTNADHASSPLSSQREGASFDFSTELNKSGDQSPDTSPSTSPIELLAAIEEPGPKRKAKDNDFFEESDNDASNSKSKKSKATTAAGKPAKPKRLTKKEKAEMERETARIISNQRVSLSRADVDKRLPLSQWTQKMSSTLNSRSASSATPPTHVPKPAPSSPIDRFSSSSAVDDLRAASKPTFTRDPKQPVVNTKDMNKVLLARSKAQGSKMREDKKQDWIRRGGSLKLPEEQKAPVMAPKAEAEADEEARDLDYVPDNGADDESGEEPGREDSPGAGSDEDDVEETDREAPPVSSLAPQSDYDMGDDTEEEDENIPLKPKALGKRRKTALVLDDSDSDQNDVQVQVLVPASSMLGFPGAQVPRRALSPVGSASESEKDKENSQFRTFDDSEDKENRAAPRFVAGAHSSLSPDPQLSLGLDFSDEEDKENAPQPVVSQPLFADRLQRRPTHDASQPRSVLGDIATEERPALATLSLDSPVRHGDDSPSQHRSLGFPPGEDDGPGLTQLFEQGEPTQRPAMLSRSVSEQIPRRLFGNHESVTQQSLQFTPTQQRRVGTRISDSQRQRDDEILAMDMDEELTQVASTAAKQDWFVKDNGLLTQTRPEFTPIHALSAPFSTLEPSPFAFRDSTPLSPKLKRLKRKSSTEPSPAGRRTQKTQTKQDDDFFDASDAEDGEEKPRPPKRVKKNAFEALKDCASHADKQKSKEKRKQMHSEYVQDQADESDDETGLGFGGISTTQEEDIDEDAIREEVADMVDDADMDVDVLAPDLVAEKHQEHLKADDEAIQQLHERAIQGKLRQRNRDGLNLEDDDSDDDGKVRRPRPAKHARNIENDSLPELAKHPETKSFYETYHNATIDDDKLECPEMDFATADDDELEIAEEEGDDREEEEAPRRRIVDPRQLREELLSKYNKPSLSINPDDVDWVSNGDDEEELDFDVQIIPVKESRGAATDRVDRDLIVKRPAAVTSTKLQSWAKLEGANKNSNARRGGAASAVTGHASSSRVAQRSSEQRKAKASVKAQGKIGQLGEFLERKRQG